MSKIIAALDVSTKKEAERLIDILSGNLWGFKIGHQLFTAGGKDIVDYVVKKESNVFLDLKYHDIPNTVASACMEAAKFGVSMINLHGSGGSEMIKSACEKTRNFCEKEGLSTPLIVGVTVLTSLSEENLRELGINDSVKEHVARLAKLCKKSGMDGVVCSPKEITLIKESCGKDFITVTPGIRPTGSAVNDQKRVTTPSDAVKMGTDYMVIGRPITKAENPLSAITEINEQIKEA